MEDSKNNKDCIDYKLIGQRLKMARSKTDYTQQKLSEELGTSVSYISQIETGKTKINLQRLAQICSILKADIGEILSGTNSVSDKYLTDEFSSILAECSPEKKKAIYNIISEISKITD